MKQQITIIDYQMGNIFSVEKKIRKLGYQVIVSSDKKQIESADKLVFPGVGHFGKAMTNLQSLGLIDVLNETVLAKKTPILGICLGMQLFARKSEEGNSEGLGWIAGEVVKFNVLDKVKYKVPHTGWNNAVVKKDSYLMKDISMDDEFYFVHAYHFSGANKEDILAETQYEEAFISCVQKENIFGVQFHPEKSHHSGQQLIKNFIDL
jgi:glutamine amidotransferase